MPTMLALEGKQLGNYDVIRRIRVGGMGAVYEGRQRTAFGRRVAIKVILGSYAADPDMRRRFEREARTVARLHHPHILPLIEFGEKQGLLYLVMPFIEGGTLTAFLNRGLPDLNELSAIFLQLLEAVEYAHDEGLIHRDIKSSNVLLEFRRSGPYVYLADFGLVRTSQQTQSERRLIPLDQIPGTPYYMAPEQTWGIVTASTDIYALGVLLYQMLLGELPYDDPDEVKVIEMHLHSPVPSPCELDPAIPVALGEVVRTAMAKHPQDRFANVAALRTAFLAATHESDPPIAIYEDRRPIDISPSFSEHRPSSPSPSRRDGDRVDVGGGTLGVPAEDEVDMESESLRSPVKSNGDVEKERFSPDSNPLRSSANPLPVQRLAVARSIAAPRVKKNRHRRFTTSVVAAMVIPIVLLVVLIVPRILGISLFPSGFPLLGPPPIATITITVQSKMLQNSYVLTASPQVKSPDLATRTIPERTLNATSTASRTIASTGTRLLAATPASGSVLLQNSSAGAITVPAGTIVTSSSGIQIQLPQSVQVPPQQNGQNGTVSASAVAVIPGQAGDIPAHTTLTTLCCASQVAVTNPQPFSGGMDARMIHIVAQADLDTVRDALVSGLEQQVVQQLQQQSQASEVMAGTPAYSTTVSSNYPVGAQVSQVLVVVSVSATVSVYDRDTATHIAAQLLSDEAMQILGNNYQLEGIPSVATPRVVQQGRNGLIYLSVSAHGLWVYHLSPQQLDQWRQSTKGFTSTSALAYFNSQPGVASVRIQLPFGADHLPTSVDQIKIVLEG